MWGTQAVHADTNVNQPVTTNEQSSHEINNSQSQTNSVLIVLLILFWLGLY